MSVSYLAFRMSLNVQVVKSIC
ncbi:hypothetical protein AZE42_09988 [Rhizopogon vesiculosus]|uniref:Uncharacterized protein n=1 Tax=Rhizopogon vesiculosus TaxID=180088 RepID=A0A1J8QR09_9AGAM|nr:hypothetical protein AZE42_09988 [Rhizopogon vesiculosus]